MFYVLQNQMLRSTKQKVFKHLDQSTVHVEWRNYEMFDDEPDVMKKIKSQRLRWTGCQIQGQNEEQWIKVVWKEAPARSLTGRPLLRSEGNDVKKPQV